MTDLLGRCTLPPLVAQIRKALRADRFGQVFAAGVRLNRREAVAAVRDRHGTGTRASYAGV